MSGTRWILDPDSGERIGDYKAWKGQQGPCLFASVPFTPDGSLRQRIAAAIACRESPMRHAKDASKAAYPLRPGRNSVQSYEWTEKRGVWISGGIVHAVTFNGNLQRLMRAVMDADPVAEEAFCAAGFDVTDDDVPVLQWTVGGELVPVPSDDAMRNEGLIIAIHRLLASDAGLSAQTDVAWELIEERDPILDEMGWLEAVEADERLRLITASLAINAGVSLFKACLRGASAKTARALTASRVHQYAALGSSFGEERAKWEAACDYVRDGVAVEL